MVLLLRDTALLKTMYMFFLGVILAVQNIRGLIIISRVILPGGGGGVYFLIRG